MFLEITFQQEGTLPAPTYTFVLFCYGVLMVRMKPRALNLLGKHSTTEPYPQALREDACKSKDYLIFHSGVQSHTFFSYKPPTVLLGEAGGREGPEIWGFALLFLAS